MRYNSLNDLDRRIVHALAVAPRAPFRQIGAVLGVADHTVARRYQALRDDAGLRVAARLDGRALGWTDWMLRLRCTPDAAGAVAVALAGRSDTSWVRLASGGTEIHCAVSAPADDWDEVLFGRLAGSRRVVGIGAYCLLHVYTGMTSGWIPTLEALTPEEEAALREGNPTTEPGARPVLADGDLALVEALGRDGRTTMAALAAATGWHESTVRRRVDALCRTGCIYFDLDIEERAFGAACRAMLWLSVAPGRLAPVGEALAGHREIPFAAATSGPTNLMASVVCADTPALYRYLSERVGALEGVMRVETTPVVRTVKRAGALSSAVVADR